MLQDFRHAARTLRQSPLFTASAILLLALGIGANTAIFSSIDETLFRPLNFPHPEQLTDLFTFNKSTQTFLSTSYPDYLDLRARAHSFQQLSAFLRMPLNINWNGTNQRLEVECVTPNFFSMLQLQPAAGRAFNETDNSSVALISEDLAAPIGQKILIEGQPFTIIGIVPKNYRGTNLNWGTPPQLWIPLQSTETVRPRFRTLDIFHQRDMRLLLVTGRLKPGINVDHAQAEIQTLAANISAPSTNRDITQKLFPASRAKFWPAYRASITRLLEAFALAAGLVLLLTCANLSNLLLSRAVTRRREFAIRLAVGATRPRLIRQLLTENLLLVLPGAALALLIAFELSRILARFPNALGISLTLEGGLDIRVLLFSLLLSALTTLLFGLAPALTATRPEIHSSTTLQNALIALQIAFSMLLLVGGGLFLHSIQHAWSIDFGFHPQGLLTAEFSIHPPGSPAESQLRQVQQHLLDQSTAAALADTAPFSPINTQTQIQADDKNATANRYTVSPAFFETIGLPLLAGRQFTPRDTPSSPAVAIISQKLAARLWPGENPLGRFLTMKDKRRQVIGIVRDSIYGSLGLSNESGSQPALYLPVSQSNYPASVLLIRNTTPATLIAAWNRLHPPSALFNLQNSAELLNTALAPQRAAAAIFGAFAILSLLIAALGLYGITAFTVARRTREIGIRLAIGAQPSAVVRQILARFITVALIGVALGTTASLLLAPFLATQAKGISVYDPAAFAPAALLLTSVAALAAILPARRAAKIQPHQALRSE
jgi:predicted permease